MRRADWDVARGVNFNELISYNSKLHLMHVYDKRELTHKSTVRCVQNDTLCTYETLKIFEISTYLNIPILILFYRLEQ